MTGLHTGLPFEANILIVVGSFVTLTSCMVAAGPACQGQMMYHFFFIIAACRTIRAEAAAKISSWIGLLLLEKESQNMEHILHGLLPVHMAEMVLSVAHEPLPAVPLVSRCGVASGLIVAGMLGKLQPRFQLLGAPVSLAQRLEGEADLDSVNASSEVFAMASTVIEEGGGGGGSSGGGCNGGGSVC